MKPNYIRVEPMRLRKLFRASELKALLSEPAVSSDIAMVFSEAILSKKSGVADLAQDVSKDLAQKVLKQPTLQRKLALASDLSPNQKEKILRNLIEQP